MNTPRVTPTDIPGLLVVDLHRVEDARGWMKEAWQREKMTAAGLPDFRPVQHNVSVNADAGVTRGFHAEPWDKLVGVTAGRVFGAWVDLREGPMFGRTVSLEVDAGRAVFVPRGVGNAYQALEDGTCYSTLINEHWSEEAKALSTYTSLDHPEVEWPIPLADALLSDADEGHPALADVEPVKRPKPLVLGADGDLGEALRRVLPDARFTDAAGLDLTDRAAVEALDLRNASALINAIGCVEADSPEAAWVTNVRGAAALVEAARRHRLPLLHLSSAVVFGDGELHDEDAPLSPRDAQAASLAAAEAVVTTWPSHYILRAARDAGPALLARAVAHVRTGPVPYGVYNVSPDGADRIAATGFDPDGEDVA